MKTVPHIFSSFFMVVQWLHPWPQLSSLPVSVSSVLLPDGFFPNHLDLFMWLALANGIVIKLDSSRCLKQAWANFCFFLFYLWLVAFPIRKFPGNPTEKWDTWNSKVSPGWPSQGFAGLVTQHLTAGTHLIQAEVSRIIQQTLRHLRNYQWLVFWV